jgi:hypothetical protein
LGKPSDKESVPKRVAESVDFTIAVKISMLAEAVARDAICVSGRL